MKAARETVMPMVASLAAGLNGDRAAAERIRELCRCRRRDEPADFFLTAGVSVLRRLLCPGVCEKYGDCEFSSVCQHLAANASANLVELTRISRQFDLEGARMDAPPLLLGDPAVLLRVYGGLEAFRAGLWVVGVSGYDPGDEESAALNAVCADGADVRISEIGRLRRVGEDTRDVELVNRRWRMPRRELLVAMLAARVGESDARPLPPMWVHLAVALQMWRGTIGFERVFELADKLRLAPQLHRGLAVTVAIVPELREAVPEEGLRLPKWERMITVPLAARRLRDDALRASPAFGPGKE